MNWRTSIVFGIALGLTAGCPGLIAGDTSNLTAALSADILGQVKNSTGVPQMGAAVYLYNRFDLLVRQVLTNEEGKFAFDGLAPDIYTVRVSLASFVPAMRRIAVLAGTERQLRINLSSVLSSIDVAPLAAPGGALMSDEWKWVLRAS